jgi:hypothetical protein
VTNQCRGQLLWICTTAAPGPKSLCVNMCMRIHIIHQAFLAQPFDRYAQLVTVQPVQTASQWQHKLLHCSESS